MASASLEQLGRYRIESELGRGAMGVVYRAHDPVLDRTVALKTIVLDEAVEDRDEYRARFFTEAKATARLNHPALITIYDFGEENALAYMAMELLSGTELGARLAQGPLDLAETVAVAEQVAEGLAYAHDNGVIHRDIKPSNIMLLSRGRAKIMDFGIARFRHADHLTQLGARLGTPRYMSPEQVAGGALDHRTDVFSLGIVLYEMLTGGKLFHGEDLTQVMHNVASFTPPAPSRINPQVTSLLDLIVGRALQKKPEDRYASASEMADDLRQCWLELAPLTRSQASQPGAVADSPGGEDDSDRTLMIKAVTGLVRAPAQVSQLYQLSPRFDNSLALQRLGGPPDRDRRQLARPPHAPGWLRRLVRDRDSRRLVLTLLLGAGLAALVVLS